MPGLGKAAPKIDQFTDEIGRFRKNLKDGMAIQDVITDILESTGYKAELMEEGEVEAETRLENISELSNKAGTGRTQRSRPWMGFWKRWPWWRTSTVWMNPRTGWY